MQKIKIGHRTKFRAKSKYFHQILFPVRSISWVIAFCLAILKSLSDEFEIITGVVGSLLGYFSLSLMFYCHLSVYFVTRCHGKQIKCEQVSPQAAADFANEKKTLVTNRITTTALLVYVLPTGVHYLFLPVYLRVVITL